MEIKEAIDYRRYYINYISGHIQDLLKELREINNMPENIIKEKINEETKRSLYFYECTTKDSHLKKIPFNK